MNVGTVKETFPGEKRVALVPGVVPILTKAGFQVLLQSSAGEEAGFADAAYEQKGATVVSDRAEVFRSCEVIVQVRSYGANLDEGRGDLEHLRPDQILVGSFEPLTSLEAVKAVAAKNVSLFAMELIPRSTRAQSMDVLSSMATVSAYKAVLLAAEHLPQMFPMMMTAAGTIQPAKVFVIGAGVAGLQAIATARRLGAQVSAYDVRPAVREEVESLGAKFLEIALDSENAQDQSGYAKALGEEFYKKQREMMTQVVAENDVVITTAAIPGKQAPRLVTTEMVKGMRRGSVIVDMAAERGGNCELTKADEVVQAYGVTVLGPLNLAATVPRHASQMYARNITSFLCHLVKDGAVQLDADDEIVRETLVTHRGEVSHPRVREALGLAGATI